MSSFGSERTFPLSEIVSFLGFLPQDSDADSDISVVAPANSDTSYTDIFANANHTVCPGNCFRPVGLAFDSQGRMFVSSDASGEIYVVTKDETANGTTGSSSPGGGSSGGKPKSGAQRQGMLSTGALVLSALACCIAL